jgi:AGCS family alanine or glycine:cation symporter
MAGFSELIDVVNSFIWGPWMLVLFVGTGLFLSLRLRFLQFPVLPYALQLAFSPVQRDRSSKGDISHFQALMTALAATMGIGNMVGVATAVVLGGPGAIFWMWITALLGMATKYSEAVLAVKYRVIDENGEMAGGPMYYIKRGLGCKWMAWLFAFCGAMAAFGIGNMVQVNAIASNVHNVFGVPDWITGVVVAILIALVIMGGIKSIGKAAGVLVPLMALSYMAIGLLIMISNYHLIPQALKIIFTEAFCAEAGYGALIGTTIRYGISRGVFSNEAGLGSAPIAAAAAKTDHPCRQALVSMTGTFLDTIVVCSVTGIVLVMAGLYPDFSEATAVILTSCSFDFFLPGIGSHVVTIGMILFAYSTILGWFYYGEKCFYYLTGYRGIKPYRFVYCFMILVGAVLNIGIVWDIADIFNGAMAVPNLIALLALSGVVVKETKDFQKIRAAEKGKRI